MRISAIVHRRVKEELTQNSFSKVNMTLKVTIKPIPWCYEIVQFYWAKKKTAQFFSIIRGCSTKHVVEWWKKIIQLFSKKSWTLLLFLEPHLNTNIYLDSFFIFPNGVLSRFVWKTRDTRWKIIQSVVI